MKDKDLVKVDVLDILLDRENEAPIYMLSDTGERLKFEQIAVIPRMMEGQETIFAVLKPLDKLEGIGEDEAIVFRVAVDEQGESVLRVEEDEEVSIAVFNEYYKLLDERLKESEKKKKKPRS